jgi:hypothetical protein
MRGILAQASAYARLPERQTQMHRLPKFADIADMVGIYTRMHGSAILHGRWLPSA